MIRTISVLGAGTMGRGIAHTFSRHGYPVRLYEPFDAVRDKAMDGIRKELDLLVQEECITEEDAKTAAANIRLYADLEEAVKDADYVIEACPEKLELKQWLFTQLDGFCPEKTIFATNTSSLRLSEIIAPLPPERQKKCMVCHWYNPPYLIPIAELSMFGNMEQSDFQSVYQLYLECGKQPVRVLKDIPGMIANRLLHAQAREAFYLLEIGAAEAADIDRALKFGPCFRNATTGMLETADMGGLDIWLAGEDNLLPALDNSTQACDALRSRVSDGRLGIKNGKGFFEYSEEQKEQAQNDFYRRLIVQLKASRHYD